VETPSRAANPASGAPTGGVMCTLLNPAPNKVSLLFPAKANGGKGFGRNGEFS